MPGGDGYFWGTTMNGGVYGCGTIYKVKADGSDWTTVLSFTNNGAINRGVSPYGALVSDEQGFFWGVTEYGGASGDGTVFKIEASTGTLTTLAEFNGANGYAAQGLASDGQGFFWGTTQYGGSRGNGTVFKVSASTGVLTTVVTFDGNNGTWSPSGGLTSDGAGYMWGRTTGALFKVNISTGQETIVRVFGATETGPSAELFHDGAGYLWGTTSSRSLLKINISTGELTDVGPGDDSSVGSWNDFQARLVKDQAGFFWGTTWQGGASDLGTVFKIDPNTGEVTTMAEFDGEHGAHPRCALVNDGAGSLWGTAFSGGDGFGTVFKVDVTTGDMTTLVNFTHRGGIARKPNPAGDLVSDGAGFFWGTTQGHEYDYGSVFKLDPSTGEFTTVVEFSGDGPTSKGAYPYGSLVNDGAGFLWGTTKAGGASNYGTVFKVDSGTGELTTIAEFSGFNGVGPYAGLVKDGGFFWGTTEFGGTGSWGTVFKINANTRELTKVVEFDGAQGYYPRGDLVSDGAGFFWGTTSSGGLFKVNAVTGELSAIAVDFRSPRLDAGLVNDGTGFFWGTTENGGTGRGSVFKVNISTGQVTTVVAFPRAGATDRGASPLAGLVNDGGGLWWGTTSAGGGRDAGTVFAINASTGKLFTAVEFTGNGDQAKSGLKPRGRLLLHTDGYFYGTTSEGGPGGGGTIFRVRRDAVGTAPSATTLAATEVLAPSAVLNASVTANGTPTSVSFEYGLDANYGATASAAPAQVTGSTATEVNASLSGLQPDTVYHFRVAGENFAGSSLGEDRTFRTAQAFVPTVITLPATDVLASVAVLHGNAVANHLQTAVSFEFGLDATYGSTVSAQPAQVTDSTPPEVAASLAGLLPDTIYHFRTVGENRLGTSRGEDRTFRTRRALSRTVVSLAGVRGAGGEVVGEPEGTTYVSVGAPSVAAEAKTMVFAGRILPLGAKKPLAVIMEGNPPHVFLRAGDPAPGAEPAAFKSFGDPLAGEDPSVNPGVGGLAMAFSAKLTDGRSGVWTRIAGDLVPVVLTGGEAPGIIGSKVISIASFSIRSSEIVILLKLKPGFGGVTAASNTAVVRIVDGVKSVLLQTGQRFDPPGFGFSSKITKISAFTPAKECPGQGRSHAEGMFAATVTLVGGIRVAVTVEADGAISVMDFAGAVELGTQYKAIGLPAVGSPVFAGLKTVFRPYRDPHPMPGADLSVNATNDEQVTLYGTPHNGTLDRLQTIREAGVNGAVADVFWGTFSEPAINDQGTLLCFASLVGKEVTKKNHRAVVTMALNGLPRIVARTGDAVPNAAGNAVAGVTFAAFGRFGLPDGADAGPLFTATLAGAKGTGVAPKNNSALYGVDSTGKLRELLRSDDTLLFGGRLKKLKTFAALTGGYSPTGGRRSFTTAGGVGVLATFTDGTTGAIRISVP